ncbi:MAG: thioredoxin domain-containing protein [Deltaproteobacteria bacterium]|nr:thioredoxin domain-containing protein [Deltaproteobacteria bacterium]
MNRLAQEKSPYLLQHAENPVDWYPWGEEAFARARAEDKPIFLSIGYSTCHWCHVMAHESFEDLEVGRLLNESFVSIKVDREERPDVDATYMAVCQAVTLRGGWPLSIFMTWEGKPFYAGTYFPRTGRMGMPGFIELLTQIAAAWQKDRSQLLQLSDKITRGIQPRAAGDAGSVPGLATLQKGFAQLRQTFDQTWGGFGQAPKFPTPHNLTFLLRWYRRQHNSQALAMVKKTLTQMRMGGIYDQLGHGFHRYSVDEKWLVPHFEKMLYDQALLAIVYAETYQLTGEPFYGEVAADILNYVLRDMTAREGGFYTAEDADSEGEEGRFYTWTPEEVRQHLSKEEAELFCCFYDVGPNGNFEGGRSIPHIRMSLEEFAAGEGMDAAGLAKILESARKRLFDAREKRIHPLKDDKILTSWNGLMIAAMARGYRAMANEKFLRAGRRAAHFIEEALERPGPRLLRRFRQGEAAYQGFADDYSFLVWGLLELYEATSEDGYLEKALALTGAMLELFWDNKGGGFLFNGKENEVLIKQTKEIYDGAVPSSNSVAAMNLLRLAQATGERSLEEKAVSTAAAFAKRLRAYPAAYTHFLSALDFFLRSDDS